MAKDKSYFNVEDGELNIQNENNTTNEAINIRSSQGGININAA